MSAAVFDTYVTRKDGILMHFDIIVPENTPFEQVVGFGKIYLAEKGQAGQPLTASECRFCHIEQASEPVSAAFAERGYYIFEMQGCN